MRKLPTKRFLVEHVRKGKKTLEVRLDDHKVQGIKPGEQVGLAASDRGVVVNVRRVTRYATVEALLDNEDVTRIAPNYTTDELRAGLAAIYHPGAVERYGLVVFEIQRVRDMLRRELES